MYDEKHRFRSIYDARGGKIKWEQKGFRDDLLCQSCETALSVYEQYASEILRNPLPPATGDESKRILLRGLDYRKLKLFLVSVLWRGSVSKHPFYSHVKLGPHEETLRCMLHAGEPGEPLDYGSVVFSLVHEGKPLRDLFVEPTPTRIESHNAYRFVFAGFVFIYFVSNHDLHPGFRKCILNKNGEMIVLQSELSKFNFLRELWSTVARSFPYRPGDSLRS